MNKSKVPHHPNEVHRISLPEGIPNPPILGLYVAKRGQGKSTAAARLLHYYVHHHPPVFQPELVFVISPTAESQYHLWDFIGVPSDNVFVAATSDEVKTLIDQISNTLAGKKQKYEEDQEYLIAYQCLLQNRRLTARQEMLLDQRDAQPLENPEPWPRPCLLLDDLSHMKVLDKPWFVSLCLRHRHIAGGVSLSMLIICQSLHGGLSRVVRQNCSLICLFTTHDKTCVEDLYRECSHLLDKEEFEAVFEHATSDFHSFLAVDLSQKNPNKVFSKNFEKYYQIRHLSQSDNNERSGAILHQASTGSSDINKHRRSKQVGPRKLSS